MLSKFSVKKPITIFVAVIIVIILGVVSFTSMTTDLLPKIELPYAVIMTTYVGASPEKVETTITKPLEQLIGTVSNVKNISSTSSENSSMVMVEFTSDVNMDSAIIELNSKVDMVKTSWKDSNIGNPMITKISPDMMPVMVAAIDIEGKDSKQITKYIKEKILPELERIDGVANVNSVGFIEDKINVTLSQDKIDNINLKVLENIDVNLAKTQRELNNAKSQLNQGKNQLNSQTKEQTAKITDGINAINEGKAKIKEAEDSLNKQEETLNFSKTELIDGINKIDTALKTLNELKTTLEALGNNITETQKEQLKDVNKQISDMQSQKAELNGKLNQVNAGLASLQAGRNEINTQKDSLNANEKELEQTKALLNNTLSSTASQLSVSESELNKGIKEFEGARDTAYKNASLEGVITQSMISNILAAQNFSMPAGYVDANNGNDTLIKVGDKFEDIEEIKNLTIISYNIPGLENITLKDLADIEFTDNSSSVYAKVNGNNGIVVTMQKQSTASTATVCNNIQETMQDLQKKYTDVRFTELMNQGVYINIIIDSVLGNLVYGGILAIIILFIFLKDIKPTFIIALSIPLSLTFAIALMYFTGVTINVISLSGLALGVGMLVDNSIVVIENIYRLRKEGYSVIDASVKGAKSVAGAIAASTLTTVCVFLPIVFIQGISRQLFTDMGLTIAYSLLASLIVALTLVPAVASKLFKNTVEKEHKLFDKFVNEYEKLLSISLKHKFVVIIFIIILLFLSIFLATRMGTEFIPSTDSTQMTVTLTMPKEATFDEMKNMSNDVIDKILTINDVDVIGAMESSMISGQSTGSGARNVGMYVILKENKKQKNTEIQKQIYDLTEGMECAVEVSASNMDMSALAGSGIEIDIKGENTDKLQEISKDIEKLLKETKGIDKVDNGIGDAMLETRITVDKNKAMEYGLTVATIYSKIAEQVSNTKDATTATIEKNDYTVVVIKPENKKITEENLMDMELEGTKNNVKTTLKLSDVSSIDKKEGLASINHDNQERYLKVTASIASGYNIGLVSKDFNEKLESYNAPDGYRIEMAGENETINQSLGDLVKMIAVAVIFIYLIMVAQFQSLLSPFIIMFTMPLAFTGGLLALFITGTPISLIAMLGFLILAGIVVNNGIVFIDYVNQLRLEGMERREAILLAGRTRIRPILMTALTTILGLSTMAMGIGSGSEMVQPLGIVTIGGLLYATILTLFFIPCMYDIMCKKNPKKIEIDEKLEEEKKI